MSSNDDSSWIPPGWQLERTLLGHNGLISRVEWAPNGIFLASPSFDRTIKLWHMDTGECLHTLKGHEGRVWAVAWSPDSKLIASGSTDNTVRFWDTSTGELTYTFEIHNGTCLNMAWSPDGKLVAAGGIGDNWSIIIMHVRTQKSQVLEGHIGQVNSVAWSPDGETLASVSHDTTIHLWDRETLELKRILTGHSADVHSVNWAPDGKMLATASLDNTIRVWNPQTGQTIFILEGHTASVNCVEFSYDGKFLASKSSDGTVRLWRCDTWETVTILSEETFKSLPFGLAFHPTQPILATLGEVDIAICIWKLDEKALLNESKANSSDLYRNAKVVLIGESGVGKTGLSLVLTNKEFRATESTHGRYVWTFNQTEFQNSDNRKELREILLWDLAGQPGYRLFHQLYLNELAVALIVCDARSETDPFAEVYYWNRALRQAEKLQGDSAPKLKKFLVTARADRGSVSANKARINELIEKLGFDGYFETSAREGWNINSLAQAICQAVEWENLPHVISSKLFQKIKVFLIQEKQAERLLSPVDDLFRSFVQTSDGSNSKQTRQEFDTCIRLVESRDLIRRLTFGNLVLLQPELLDAYALAIINAAKDEPDGLGCIPEEDVLAGRFRIPSRERINDKQQEKLLLIATVEELFAREIALREQTETGPLLVFPSQMTREWPEAPDPEGKAVIFGFEGAIVSIYTTLVVRLSRSAFFKCKEMWKNAAIFEAQVGGECGIWLRHIGNIDEGKAELTVFFKQSASEQTRLQFEEYVHTHLKRRAIPSTIKRKRIFVCTECGTSVNELYVTLRRKRGFDWINCSVCDTKISLVNGESNLKVARTEIPAIIPEIDKTSVLLVYQKNDKEWVQEIAKQLEENQVKVYFKDNNTQAVRVLKEIVNLAAVAVCFGEKAAKVPEPEEKDLLDFESLIAESLRWGKVVIPVILPNFQKGTKLPDALQTLRSVDFRKSKPDPIDLLIWAITGILPKKAKSSR